MQSRPTISPPIVLFAVMVLFHSSWVTAEPKQSIYELSLEQLLNIKVSAPSKSPQSINNTPGIVTTFTEQEILLFGGRDLGEVLGRIPGFEEFGTLINGRNIVTIRADQPTGNNNHVLFLLNGIPFNRESYTGGIWNEAVLLSIPLTSIKQLEVIRGPGSVLYGTNAFSGVVNIITKSSAQITSNISIAKGAFGTQRVNLSLAGSQNDWHWTSTLRLYNTDGWSYKTNNIAGELFSEKVYSKSPGLVLTLSKDNFTANVFWGRADQFTIRGNSNLQEAASTDNEKYFIDLGYEMKVWDDWTLSTHLSHVRGRTEHKVSGQTAGNLTTINYETDDSRLEFTFKKQLSERSNLLFGTTLDYFSGRTPPPVVVVPDWSNYLYGLYGQYEIQYSQTKYILGAQYNKAQNSYDSLVPRLGLIHHIDDNHGIKLFYGKAFRAPFVVEREIDVAIANLSIKGDKNIKPEYVSTWDLQYFYSSKKSSASATIFRNEQDDLIVRAPVSEGVLQFVNQGKLTIEGLELEGKYIRNKWYLNGSYTWQRNEDGDHFKNSTLQPHSIIKVGLGYTGDN